MMFPLALAVDGIEPSGPAGVAAQTDPMFSQEPSLCYPLQHRLLPFLNGSFWLN